MESSRGECERKRWRRETNRQKRRMSKVMMEVFGESVSMSWTKEEHSFREGETGDIERYDDKRKRSGGWGWIWSN